jgi:hypothetical protein
MSEVGPQHVVESGKTCDHSDDVKQLAVPCEKAGGHEVEDDEEVWADNDESGEQCPISAKDSVRTFDCEVLCLVC